MFKCNKCGEEERLIICESCEEGEMIYSDKDLLTPANCNSKCYDCGGPAYQGAGKPICLDGEECGKDNREGLESQLNFVFPPIIMTIEQFIRTGGVFYPSPKERGGVFACKDGHTVWGVTALTAVTELCEMLSNK